MSLFKQNTGAAIQTARDAFDAATARVAELETARAVALAATEISSIDEIERIDCELDAQRHAASIYHERIEALAQRQRADERARREQEKAAAIADIGRRLARRNAAAIQLDQAIAAVLVAIAKLDRADEAVFSYSDWPSALPSDLRWACYSVESLKALQVRPAGVSDVPAVNEQRMVVGPLRALARKAPFDLAPAVQEKGRGMIEMLQGARLPEAEASEVEASGEDVAA